MIDSRYSRHYLWRDKSYNMINRANNHFGRRCAWQWYLYRNWATEVEWLTQLYITWIYHQLILNYGWCQRPSDTLHDIFYVDQQCRKPFKISSLPKLCSHYTIFWTIYAYVQQHPALAGYVFLNPIDLSTTGPGFLPRQCLKQKA